MFSLVNDQRLAAGKPRECLRTHAKDLRQHCLSLCLAHLRRSLAATPAWRSRPPIAVAHVAAPALGFLNPLIYKNPAAFNDIDTGRVASPCRVCAHAAIDGRQTMPNHLSVTRIAPSAA